MARAGLVSEPDAAPDAGRLEGFKHPREASAFYGHEAAEQRLAGGLQSGMMHHAWLITGPQGIGKATLAYRFARAALGSAEDRDPLGSPLAVLPESRSARQIAALSHPGLAALQRGYDPKTKRIMSAITVDDVRGLKNFLSLSTGAGGWRVVIVDTADDLNRNAANALLKSLEEPPARTVFLILSSAPGRLLPTIRSRCQVLALSAFDDAALKSAVTAILREAVKPPISDQDFDKLLRLAEGSIRRVLTLHGAGGLDLQKKVEALLSPLPRLDVKSVHALADELSPTANEESFTLFFDLFSAALRRLVRAQATGQGHEEDITLASRIIGPGRLATFAALWETLERERAEALDLNLDRKALIVGQFAQVEAACAS